MQIKRGYYTTSVGLNTVESNLELVRIALQLKDDSLIADSYNWIGDYYLFEKGDINTGLDYLFKGVLIPLHHRMEKWIKEKMTEKNKKIRLDNAKKAIEKLENGSTKV